MEEADVLGDKIAVMSKGRIVKSDGMVANDTSIRLKQHFGGGLTLSVYVPPDNEKRSAVRKFVCEQLITTDKIVPKEMLFKVLKASKIFETTDESKPSDQAVK